MLAASPTVSQDPQKAAKRERSSGKQHEATGFSVPFVWETSKDDPLAIARGHLKAILADNTTRARERRAPKQAQNSPRSTVLTCADAAIQMDALDATPENDVYVVRNWGNVVDPALGSLAYGIEHLGTPVLLIVGHTGCDAVKAAIDDATAKAAIGSTQGGNKASGATSKALTNQLSKVAVAPATGETPSKDPILESVLHNINEQVEKAVKLYRPLVHTGTLTVVGALYDSHNSLKRGHRRLSIVNVNTVTDPQAMQAFVTAITHDDKIVTHGNDSSLTDEQANETAEPQPPEAPRGAPLHGSVTRSQREPVHAHPSPSLPRIDGLEASLVPPMQLIPRDD
jgi:carbonic anhydrase